MDQCYFTGSNVVERHHIFGGANKSFSEKYDFIIPLRPDIHPNGASFNPPEEYKDIDTRLKDMARAYYIEHIGTEEEFIAETQRIWRKPF